MQQTIVIANRFQNPGLDLLELKNFIDGQHVAPTTNQWLENENPATGEVFSLVPDSGAEDIANAVQAAESAFSGWSRLSADVRAGFLHKIANQVDAHLDELAELESRDNGKPLTAAKTIDIPRASLNLRFFAGLITSFASESHAQPNAINYTRRQPLGAVGCISPWNLPLYLFTWKIAPALAAGNCVVAKPSEVTPATAHRFSELCVEAGLPPGVLNVVHGTGQLTGDALTSSRVKAISFTGGTATGRAIASKMAPTFKKLALELGGKNPNLIFADCQYDKALLMAVRAAFSNQGQICLCGSRLLIEESIYDRFRDDLIEKTKLMRVGDPLQPETQVGAMVSRSHYEKVLGCIEKARDEGGKVLCGGNATKLSGRCENGYFIAPTIIEGLDNQCETNQSEIFGPVVTLQNFSSDEEAVQLANDIRYGLSASIWTQDISRAHQVAEKIEAGVVWINSWLLRDLRTPFGGFKESGVGREGGLESLRFWTQPKNICVAM